jgi:hypothetical protein
VLTQSDKSLTTNKIIILYSGSCLSALHNGVETLQCNVSTVFESNENRYI